MIDHHDQTQFIQDETLRESPAMPEPVQQQSLPTTDQPSHPAGWRAQLQRRPIQIGAVAGLVMLTLIIWLLTLSGPKQLPPIEPLPVNTGTPAPVSSDFAKRLEEAKAALEDADPSLNQFPFPPVSDEIEL